MTRLNELIALARIEAGLNQEQLAEAVGVEPPTVSRWESGSMAPRPARLAKIAKALHKPVSWFTDGGLQNSDLLKRLEQLEDKVSSKHPKNSNPLIIEATEILSSLNTSDLKAALKAIRAIDDLYTAPPLSVPGAHELLKIYAGQTPLRQSFIMAFLKRDPSLFDAPNEEFAKVANALFK